MLQSIRDRTQGWIAGIIISLLILSFALWGIHSYFIGGSANTTVAEVNGVEITKGQLAVAYERLRRQMQSQFGSNNELPGNVDAGLKDRALQALVNIQVLKQSSLKQNYYISSAQVDSFLENMAEFQVNGQFSITRFQQALATTMYTPSEFLELIKTSLLIDQPRLGLIFSSFALPNEIADSIALVNQERDIQYIVIPYQYFAEQSVNISEQRIQAYYEQHQSEFKTPEQVSIEYVELSVKNLMNRINVTDDELKSFYNESTNTFAQPAQWRLDTLLVPVSDSANENEIAKASEKINAIAAQANKGINFSSLAKENSLKYAANDATKWVTQNQVPSDLQKTLSALTKPGQIAGPVKVSSGFMLLKAIGYKEAQLMPFDQVKEKVKEAYIHQKAEELFTEMREKLANVSYEHPDSLQQVASELGLTIQTSGLFAKDKAGTDISASTKIRETAFSNDVLNLQNNSDVIQISPDSAVVVRVKSHIPSTLLSLKAVQQQILDKLKVSDIDEKTFQVANEARKKLMNGSDSAQIIRPYAKAWSQIGFIQRHSTKVDSAILDTAFEMPKPLPGKFTYAIAKLPNGYAIVGLRAIKNGKVQNAEEMDVYSEQIQNTQGLLEYELYKQSLMNQAKIISS